jgi:hypothetical protein
LEDNARPTIKQTTQNNNYISNNRGLNNKNQVYLDDEAKPTIKQTTQNNNYISNNRGLNNKNQVYLDDEAKPTIKQTTQNNSYISNNRGLNNKNQVYLDDDAKPTIKQTTINNQYQGGLRDIEKPRRNEDISNQENNCKDEILEGRLPTMTQEKYGPNEELINMELKEHQRINRINQPTKILNENLMLMMEIKKKEIKDDYNINTDFMVSLKRNPLINNHIINQIEY